MPSRSEYCDPKLATRVSRTRTVNGKPVTNSFDSRKGISLVVRENKRNEALARQAAFNGLPPRGRSQSKAERLGPVWSDNAKRLRGSKGDGTKPPWREPKPKAKQKTNKAKVKISREPGLAVAEMHPES